MIRTLVEIQGGRVSIRETAAETTVTVTVDSASSDPGLLGAAAGRADRIQDLEAELLSATRHADALEQELERHRQDGVAELVAAPLRRQLNEALTRARKTEAEVERQRERAEKAERDRDTFKAQAYEQNDRAAKERKRADQNKDWAERAEARLAKDAESHMRAMSTQVSATAGMKERVRVLERKVVEYDRDRTTERDRADQNKAWAERAEAKGARDRDQIGKINGAVHSPEILMALQYDVENWDEKHGAALANAVRNVRQILGYPEPGTSQA